MYTEDKCERELLNIFTTEWTVLNEEAKPFAKLCTGLKGILTKQTIFMNKKF